MANDLVLEMSRRKRAAWRTFEIIEEVAVKTPANLFESTVLPVLICIRLRDLSHTKDERRFSATNNRQCWEWHNSREWPPVIRASTLLLQMHHFTPLDKARRAHMFSFAQFLQFSLFRTLYLPTSHFFLKRFLQQVKNCDPSPR